MEDKGSMRIHLIHMKLSYYHCAPLKIQRSRFPVIEAQRCDTGLKLQQPQLFFIVCQSLSFCRKKCYGNL